jgi:hypothetical protein
VAEHIPEMPSDEEKGKEPTKAPDVLPWNVRHKGVRFARDKVDGYVLLFRHVYIYLFGRIYGFVILKQSQFRVQSRAGESILWCGMRISW